MNSYVGLKTVRAKEMSRLDYNKLRGWQVPDDENPEDEGYLVQYPDSKPNHPDYEGYISWCPKEPFEKHNRPFKGMSFGDALEYLKRKGRVARRGWNGKNMFLFLVDGSTFKVNRPPLLGIYEEGTEINYHAHIDMRTADGQIVPWLASQSDMLSEDWYLVNK
jgi:hypothetical protein